MPSRDGAGLGKGSPPAHPLTQEGSGSCGSILFAANSNSNSDCTTAFRRQVVLASAPITMKQDSHGAARARARACVCVCLCLSLSLSVSLLAWGIQKEVRKDGDGEPRNLLLACEHEWIHSKVDFPNPELALPALMLVASSLPSRPLHGREVREYDAGEK